MNFKVLQLSVLAMASAMGANAQDLDLRVIEHVNVGPRIVDIVHAGDGSDRLYLVRQNGFINILEDGALSQNLFLDITSLVGGDFPEQGLLSMAFSPDFAQNRLFYTYFTNRQGNSQLARFRVDADSGLAIRDSMEPILSFNQPAPNHNGGQLAFGPDGYLYLSTGDGGGANDEFGTAQDLNSLLGKLLRIDPESVATGYAIPADNPFVGTGARPEIWAYGLRNPWRIAFDRDTGDLYIADVGQISLEEINFQPAGSPGGQNYGWPLCEGSRRPSLGAQGEPCNLPGAVLPVAEYGRSLGCSIIGGHVYRGNRYPRMQGSYFFGDFCSGRIWSLRRENGSWQQTVQAQVQQMPISTFGIDEAGELYVAELFPGRLYRLGDDAPVEPGMPTPIQPAHSGNWYDPAQSGHGIQIEILSEQQALIWWFTFDPSGAPAWIGGGGPIVDNVIVVPAYTVTGGRFPPNFDSGQVGFEPWGEIRIRFDGCDSGWAEWDPVAPGYPAGNMPLARSTRIAGLSCD